MQVRVGPHFPPFQSHSWPGKSEVGKINRKFLLRELSKQPVEELHAEQRVEFQSLFADGLLAQDLRVGKAGVLRLANQSSLREGAGQSAREGGFAVQHGSRQLSVDD